MSQHRPVPRLDLAPKLKQPLSLWHPFDYLRLLYWVIFFPQALRWYLDAFGTRFMPVGKITRLKVWRWLRRSPIERQLILQGSVLTVFIPLAIGVIFHALGFSVYWPVVLGGFFFGLVSGLVGGVTVGKKFSVALGVASGVASGVAFNVGLRVVGDLLGSGVRSLAVGLASSTVDIVGRDLAGYLANGVESGVMLGLASGVASSVASGIASGMGLLDTLLGVVKWCVSLGIFSGLALGIYEGVVFGLVGGVTFSVAFGMAFGVAILRLDSWLFGLLLARSRNESWRLSHVTPLPIYCCSSQLKNWLRRDWETGLYNANQLLAYTLQFIPVIHAVNRVLAETPPDQVLSRVAQLAEAPYDWKLVRFASEKLSAAVKSDVFKLRLDTPARAAAAGFWYLHEAQPKWAVNAFAVVRSLSLGEEMFTLAQTLAAFCEVRELLDIAFLQVPAPPKNPLLRSATWKAIASLRRVVEEVQIIQQRRVSRSVRTFALNRALGELTNILDKDYSLPEAERRLIVSIAQSWKESLLRVTNKIGEISITESVRNPYMVGDPVQENLFVGREDVLRQLEELWVMHRLQSVVLYGHRRMGKTSILLNAANCSGSEVKVAYVNLLSLGDSPQGVGEVLMAISDAISDAVGCTPPSDADLLNLPYRTFERYLKQVVEALHATSLQGLIVALDEFEKIEELIEAEKIPKDFMGYLRGLVQMSSKVAFAFAGLHTLEEMTADYFQPFFASVIPIHVGFLQPGATRQILANPDEDFPLDYTPEALDQIYALTAGQPYLVQLVGFQLVRRYNDYVFEQGRPRDPVFTVEDVEAVINDPEFFKRGRYYFDGVWGQAARGASGQQAILKALAPHPEGLSIDALVHSTGMDEETLQEALKTLKRHDVVEEREGCWQIIVELFRRWVLQP